MKKLRFVFSLCLGLSLQLTHSALEAQESKNDRAWLMFAAELDYFLENADRIHRSRTEASDEKVEEEINDLFSQGMRIANLYFENLKSEDRPEIEAYLHETLISNSDLDPYFSILGNSFYERAQLLEEEEELKDKKLMRRSVIGGTVVGFLAGGGILFFRPYLVQGAFKSAGLFFGLGAAGAGLGWGGSALVTSFVLPANPGVKNAQDFLEQYPDGQDFIQELRNVQDEDLRLSLLELEEIESEVLADHAR